MLPVLIYEPDEAIRASLLDGLDALKGKGLSPTRVNLSTGSLDGMRRAIEAEDGIALAIFGVPDGKAGSCTELGNLVMRRNRFSYTLFCLHDAGDLSELLENCLRPAGILTAPLRPGSLSKTLVRILQDYQSMTDDSAPGDDCLIIEANSTVYRLYYDEIIYLEALDKLLTIHTQRQEITVRRSLSALEGTLPEAFVRCHRAYILNSKYIGNIDYGAMSLTLTNGDALPISRGQRAELKKRFGARREATT